MVDPLQLPLKDIHMPVPVSWWPPAPGWWILVCLLIAIVLLSMWWYRRKQRIKLSAINLARQELRAVYDQYSKHQDAKRLVSEISVLLRRLSISAFPRQETASLTGTAWLRHLDKPMQDSPFTTGCGKILMNAPYQRGIDTDEIDPLVKLCENWINTITEYKERVTR